MKSTLENEKNSKYDQYESKIMNLSNSIDETKENNNKKFNDLKENVYNLINSDPCYSKTTRWR